MNAIALDVTKIPTEKQVVKQIDAIGKAGKALDKLIHETALACLAHAAQFGDTRLFVRLYESISKGGRRKALVAWAMKSSPYFLFDDKDKGLRYGMYKPEVKVYKEWDWETLTNVPFYEQEEALQSDVDKLKAQLDAIMTAGDVGKLILALATKLENTLEGNEAAKGKQVANDDREKVAQKVAALKALAA